MISIITAFLNSLTGGFNFASTRKDKQLETEFLKDDKRKSRALIIANELFQIVDDSNGYITDKDMKLVERMRKKFDELIIE